MMRRLMTLRDCNNAAFDALADLRRDIVRMKAFAKVLIAGQVAVMLVALGWLLR